MTARVKEPVLMISWRHQSHTLYCIFRKKANQAAGVDAPILKPFSKNNFGFGLMNAIAVSHECETGVSSINWKMGVAQMFKFDDSGQKANTELRFNLNVYTVHFPPLCLKIDFRPLNHVSSSLFWLHNQLPYYEKYKNTVRNNALNK